MGDFRTYRALRPNRHKFCLSMGLQFRSFALRPRRCFALTVCAAAFAQCLHSQCRFTSGSTDKHKPLTYAFEPLVLDGKLVLRVTLEFVGGGDGTVEVELPSDWAGQTHLEEQVANIHAISNDARVLDTIRPNVKTVRSPANRLVKISYDLSKDWEGVFEYPKQFRAVLEPTFFELTTQNALVHPKLSPAEVVSAHFDWQKLPAEWTLETSFGTDDRCQSFTGPWIQVENALFTGGDFWVHHVEIERVLVAEREFWGDYDFPYYLVTLEPFEVRGGSSDGSAFTNAFWLYLLRGQTFSYGAQYLLAHESFHAWNPHKMGVLREPEASEKWFSEGFTVYYSDVLLMRSGLLPLSEYIERMNRRIRDYESSSVKNLSNREVVTRHREETVNQLPYVRGPILALWLDGQIRGQSKNKSSLDAVMLTLVRQSSERPAMELSSRRVMQVAGEHLSRKSRKMMHRLVEEGVSIPIPDFVRNPCVHLTADHVSLFDLGFDSDVLRSKNLISGVREDSEAFKAGVRDGQEVLGMSIYWGDVSKPVKLTVRSAAGQQTIEYVPKGNIVSIPQYHLDKEVWASTPERCTFPSN